MTLWEADTHWRQCFRHKHDHLMMFRSTGADTWWSLVLKMKVDAMLERSLVESRIYFCSQPYGSITQDQTHTFSIILHFFVEGVVCFLTVCIRLLVFGDRLLLVFIQLRKWGLFSILLANNYTGTKENDSPSLTDCCFVWLSWMSLITHLYRLWESELNRPPAEFPRPFPSLVQILISLLRFQGVWDQATRLELLCSWTSAQ